MRKSQSCDGQLMSLLGPLSSRAVYTRLGKVRTVSVEGQLEGGWRSRRDEIELVCLLRVGGR